jgi:hypothetical protein
MTTHLGLLITFSIFVSLVFAVLMRDEPRAQLLFGLRLLAGFIGAALALSWLLYFFPL